MKQAIKPNMIILSKRANIFYLEHCRVMQKDERVIFLSQTGSEIETYFNLPEKNTVYLLLGKGTSITDSAARRLADANVMFGFVGNGGSPAFSMTDMVFLSGISEYRPTEYMQAWAKIFFDEDARKTLAEALIKTRIQLTHQAWQNDEHLVAKKIHIPEELVQKTLLAVEKSDNTMEILTAEGRWAKQLYKQLAEGFSIDFIRDEGKRATETSADIINGMLDQGNYIAYGYAATAIQVLGISFAMPVLHGKTRRGGLVFDIADLVKDAFVMPHAFYCGSNNIKKQEFRDSLIELLIKNEIMDIMIDFLKHNTSSPTVANSQRIRYP